VVLRFDDGRREKIFAVEELHLLPVDEPKLLGALQL
jgi:hypothetical protein